MSIKQLNTIGFRNLKNCNVELNQHVNFIIGDNGSGKSSFLESIFFLAHGKSFRTSSLENLVSNEEDQLVVSLFDNEGNQLGLSKKKGDLIKIRVNRTSCQRLSELARYIAVQVITPESFRLFFGGPKERRKLIDLGLFHVEHLYVSLWQQFNKVLKQRNALLKSRRFQLEEFEFWTQQFCQLSEQLNEFRYSYLVQLREELNIWLEKLLPKLAKQIEVKLYNGWSSSQSSLPEVLKRNIEREKKLGFSVYGAQKFDLICECNGDNIEQILSRGQQKLFIIALILAQSALINKFKKGSPPIVLIDDIGAELDVHARQLFAKAIAELQSQILITAIEYSAIDTIISELTEYKMFHVEHGVITENNKG